MAKAKEVSEEKQQAQPVDSPQLSQEANALGAKTVSQPTEDVSGKVTSQALKTELAKFSPDSALVLDHLRSKSPEELKTIAGNYKSETGRNLGDDLAKSFSGSERVLVTQALQGNLDDTTRVRANVLALGELSGNSNKNVEKDLRDTFATMNKEQIDKVAAEYKERFGRVLVSDLQNNTSISADSKQALSVYMKGTDNRSSEDVQRLAGLALASKNIDMMRETFRDASPEARQQFLGADGEKKIKAAFGSKEAAIALDYVNLGRLDVATAVKHNSSFAGDNEAAIYFAAASMSKQQKDDYAQGRLNAERDAAGLTPGEQKQVEFYRKVSEAFKDPLSDREMLICEDKILSPGGKSTVSKIAEMGGFIGASGKDVNAALKAMPPAELERLQNDPQFRKNLDSAINECGLGFRDRLIALHMLDEIARGKFKPEEKKADESEPKLSLAERVDRYTHLTGDDKAGFLNSLKNPEASRIAGEELKSNPSAMAALDKFLSPEEKKVALAIIEQGGKATAADDMRASLLGVGQGKAGIAEVLKPLSAEAKYLARSEYEHKYGSSLVSDVSESTRGRERVTALDLLRTPFSMREDYNNRRDAVYKSVDGVGRSWVDSWDGTGDLTHDVLEQYAAANSRYARDFESMSAADQKQLSENLSKALDLYKDSKTQAADAAVTVALTGIGVGGAAFTGGASLGLLATAGGVISVGAKAVIEGADYNKSGALADGLGGAVSAGAMGFGGRQLAEMLKLGQQAAGASASAVLKGSETIAQETGVALIKPGAQVELEKALAAQIRDSIASGAEAVPQAKLDMLARQFATSPENASALSVLMTMELNKALKETGTNAVKRVVQGTALASGASGTAGVAAGTVHGIDEWSDKKTVSANMANLAKHAVGTGAEYMTVSALGQGAMSGIRASFREGVKRLESGERMAEAKVVSDLASDAAKLEATATVDPITNLLNKNGSEQALVKAVKQIERAEEKGESRDLTLLMIDLDNFKAVNDHLGHDRGDEVLEVMGKYLKDRLRTSDKVGRLGGDEYLAVLPDTKDTVKLMQDIQSLRIEAGPNGVRLLKPEEVPAPGTYIVKASAGATERQPGEAASDLLARADHEMYLDKAARKGKTVEAAAPVETKALAEDTRADGVMQRVVGKREEDELLALNAGNLRRISEGLRQDVSSMRDRETIDPLTGLLNGKTIRSNLESLVSQSERALEKGENRPLTVVYIDMDGLKGVNDKLGHQNGDQSLRFMGQQLKELARDSDYVAHISGDEYMMLLPDTANAQAIAQRLDKLRFAMSANGDVRPIAAGEALKEGEVKIGFSAGIVTKQAGETAEMVRQRADALMHDNKLVKKTHQVFHASEIPEQLNRARDLQAQGKAMEADKLLNDIQFAREHQHLAGKKVREEREGLVVLE
ncbi:MAG: GGDEF domain-containing protein [Candidatus Obscuribacter sp.]|nr:GGDEF domain-containing protein [Candidatus Obscuribacter sp.]